MANEEMRKGWSIGGAGWVANQRIFDAVLGPCSDELLEAATPAPGQRVLDVGCGTGTLLEAAVAAGASAVGVDISDTMVAAARARVPDATVLIADAQVDDLRDGSAGGDFDLVLSRFGVMFFDDPVAAFANIRRACVPGARLAFVCWREGENAMFTLGTSTLLDRLEPQPEADPNAPGPLAFGDPERVRRILHEAGWSGVDLVAVDTVADFGLDGTDGVEERLEVILSGSLGRLARAELEPRLGEQGWAELVDEVRDELRSHLVDGVVRFPARTWLVTAENPVVTAGSSEVVP
ncbi:class I SAM-dependent methyltransferase [Nocardioides sp. JQ2195]|uniref:class I SAM-dependent methyltransferase n=1 Tax=Nocardioides sp. JQ2195 TaxID=2592334 RepID=UPI00143EA21D|nr:class I SAM-dependent methyltransferase [Nocardioides sp. JQ2195]QIX25447.1 class I SAM-dependent methyltransferase [Nocardioides sp. JQ2195]